MVAPRRTLFFCRGGQSLNQALPRRCTVVVLGQKATMSRLADEVKSAPLFSGAVPASCVICPFKVRVYCRPRCSNACHTGRIEFPKSLPGNAGDSGDATAAVPDPIARSLHSWELSQHGEGRAGCGMAQRGPPLLVTGRSSQGSAVSVGRWGVGQPGRSGQRAGGCKETVSGCAFPAGPFGLVTPRPVCLCCKRRRRRGGDVRLVGWLLRASGWLQVVCLGPITAGAAAGPKTLSSG